LVKANMVSCRKELVIYFKLSEQETVKEILITDNVKYRRLLEQELKLCRQSQKQIVHRAKKSL